MSKIVDPKDFPFLRIAACSYEGSIFGWKVEENAEQMEMTSKLTFGFNASIGALKAIACSLSGKYLVVGGMDERIRIYDMHDNKAVGELSQHTGAVTSLKFFNDSYLISASEDFNLCIWRVYDWQCVHILGGHKDTIHDFSIHPTGMMALSVSKDGTLKLWNLVQGRCAFTRRLKSPTDQVLWHESGDYYMLVSARDIQLYKAADNSCLATHTHGSRINRACFTTVTTTDTSSSTSSSTPSTTEAGAADWRMVTVCDNKTVNMFDFQGHQTACVDLTPLGSTRPRDVFSVCPNSAAVQDADMKEVLQSERCCLVLATSSGQVLVLSANNVERLGMAGAAAGQGEQQGGEKQGGGKEGEKEEELSVGSCVLSSHQVKAEPRLTAIVAWNPAAAAALFAARGSKRPRSILDCDVRSEEGDQRSVDQEDNEGDGEREVKTKAKVKKVKIAAIAASATATPSAEEPKHRTKKEASAVATAGKNKASEKPVAAATGKKDSTSVVVMPNQKDSSVAKKVKGPPTSAAADAPVSNKAKISPSVKQTTTSAADEEAEEHDADKVVSFYTEEKKPKGNDKFKKGKGNKGKGKGNK